MTPTFDPPPRVDFDPVPGVLETAADSVRWLYDTVGQYVEDKAVATGNPLVGFVGGAYRSVTSQAGNMVAGVVDLPGTVQAQVDDVKQSIKVGQQYGTAVGIGHQVGVLQFTEGIFGTDVMTGQTVDPWQKFSESSSRIGGTAGTLAGGLAKVPGMKAAPRGGAPSSTRHTLQRLQTRIGTYGRRAELAAWKKGLSGTEAGGYADRYLSKAVYQLDSRLRDAGSQYRVFAQHGRSATGRPVAPFNRPAGSLFLDAALTNRAETTVFSGWDIRFQSTPYPRWNTAADNAAYVNRFQIQEGFVREISVEARRP